MKPSSSLIEEVKRCPNGWVYQIAGEFRDDEFVPPEAIMGAWKVDQFGNLEGDFIPNPNYDPAFKKME
jgi:hypothetical protein